jgi:hypothetical protein
MGRDIILIGIWEGESEKREREGANEQGWGSKG